MKTLKFAGFWLALFLIMVVSWSIGTRPDAELVNPSGEIVDGRAAIRSPS